MALSGVHASVQWGKGGLLRGAGASLGFRYQNTLLFYLMIPLFLVYIAVLRKLEVEIHSGIGPGYF